MKKLLIIILALCTLCLSSCGALTKGIAVEQNKEYTKIILDNFEGKKKIDILHDSPNESGLYYSTNITCGSVTVSCDQGLLWDTDKLFAADAVNNITDGGYYIDSSTSKITIIIDSNSSVTGEIYIGFKPFEQFSKYKIGRIIKIETAQVKNHPFLP